MGTQRISGEMMEKPILFSASMVNAILEGRKTQTRRVIEPQPRAIGEKSWFWQADKEQGFNWNEEDHNDRSDFFKSYCRYGSEGDTLWVRENIRFGKGYDGVKPKDIPKEPHIKRWYEADTGIGQVPNGFGKLRPSIFMPRYFSRITLEITDIRVERLMDISESDAQAEGTPDKIAWSAVRTTEAIDRLLSDEQKIKAAEMAINPPITRDWRGGFHRLWASINGKESLMQNPFVWVIEFKRVS